MADLPDWLIALLGGQQGAPAPAGPAAPTGLLGGFDPSTSPLLMGRSAAATPDVPQVADETAQPPTAAPVSLAPPQPRAGPTSNVIGTPNSGAPETPSPLGGINNVLGNIGNAIGGIYGAGGPGDALIALGLSNRTGGKSIEALNAAGNQRLNQAKLAAFNLQMQQETARQNQTFNYLKSKGLGDTEAMAAISNPDLQRNLFARLAPTSSFKQFTDKDGTVWQQDQLTGQMTKLDEALKPQLVTVKKADGTVEQRWLTPGTGTGATDQEESTSAKKSGDNVAVGEPTPDPNAPENARTEKNLAQIFSKLPDTQAAAIAGSRTLEAISRQRDFLDKGALTGSGAELMTNFRAVLAQALGGVDQKVVASQGFDAAASAKAAEIARAITGSGHTTNMQETIGKAIAGGNRNLMEAAIRSTLDANETLAKESITRHNASIDAYGKLAPKNAKEADVYRVEMPDFSKQQQPQDNDPLAMARAAIAAGKDPRAVRNRLLQHGIDPKGL
jgi:hypothetical protein